MKPENLYFNGGIVRCPVSIPSSLTGTIRIVLNYSSLSVRQLTYWYTFFPAYICRHFPKFVFEISRPLAFVMTRDLREFGYISMNISNEYSGWIAGLQKLLTKLNRTFCFFNLKLRIYKTKFTKTKILHDIVWIKMTTLNVWEACRFDYITNHHIECGHFNSSWLLNIFAILVVLMNLIFYLKRTHALDSTRKILQITHHSKSVIVASFHVYTARHWAIPSYQLLKTSSKNLKIEGC